MAARSFTRITEPNISTGTRIGATNHPRSINLIDFSSYNVGWLSVAGRSNNSENKLMRSNDAGLTWQLIELPRNGSRTVTALKAFGYDTVVVSLEEDIYKTTDGGTNWTKVFDSNQGNMMAFYFTDNFVGYAAGGERILKTTDQGTNWTIESIIPDSDHRDLYDGWVAGAKAKVYSSSNYALWMPSYPLGFFYGDMYDMAAPSPTVIYAAGNNGLVVKSIDAGANWSYVGDTSINTDFKGIYFTTPDMGWAVGSNGIISATTDGGLNWATSVIASEQLNDIAFTNDMMGVIIGNNGTILRTDDGGLNWNAVFSGTNKDLVQISARDTSAPVLTPDVVFMPDSVSGGFGVTVSVPIKATGLQMLPNYREPLTGTHSRYVRWSRLFWS